MDLRLCHPILYLLHLLICPLPTYSSLLLVTVIQGDFVELPPIDSIYSRAEEETTLPCLYKPDKDNVVVQVTWYKETPGDIKEQIITVHHTNGQTGKLAQWPRSSGGHSTASATCEKSLFKNIFVLYN